MTQSAAGEDPAGTTMAKSSRRTRLVFRTATVADASDIARVRSAAAEALTRAHGHGHWSSTASERAVLHALGFSRFLLVFRGRRAVGTLRLATRKPWAIEPTYFSEVARPLYLTDMAVEPDFQRQGIGRQLLAKADQMAQAWPAEAIRLDAYDSPAGAGAFYATCGYREVGRVTYKGNPLIYYERLLS